MSSAEIELESPSPASDEQKNYSDECATNRCPFTSKTAPVTSTSRQPERVAEDRCAKPFPRL